MSRRGRSGLALLSLSVLALGWTLGEGPRVIEVAAGPGSADAVATAPPGSIVRLLPGAHGPFTVRSPISIVAEPGATVGGGIRVRADGVRITGLTVVGGENGITIREADGVALIDVVVRGAELHGVEVVDGSATIVGCRIEGLASAYAQGIEIRNANGRPRTSVEACTVSSGQEGIVSHVSRVEFRDNVVTGTTLRGITVTEMSEGLVRDNVVRDALGAGLYCGDMSHCDFVRNRVLGVAGDDSGSRSRSGVGAVAMYYSTMRLQGNAFEVSAEPVLLLVGSTSTDRSPLAVWPAGWRGALPGLWVAAIAIAALVAVRAGVLPWLRRRTARPSQRGGLDAGLPEGAAAVLLAGFAVQTFHMLEHGVQVFQVYVAEAEHRSGLAGRVADVEWVHFAYNAGVLLLMLWAARLVLRGGSVALPIGAAASLLAATAIQAYHFAEHTAKVIQHAALAIDPAPGILGGRLGLVWFHFGINLTVYAGFAAAILPLLRRVVRPSGDGRIPAAHPRLA